MVWPLPTVPVQGVKLAPIVPATNLGILATSDTQPATVTVPPLSILSAPMPNRLFSKTTPLKSATPPLEMCSALAGLSGEREEKAARLPRKRTLFKLQLPPLGGPPQAPEGAFKKDTKLVVNEWTLSPTLIS